MSIATDTTQINACCTPLTLALIDAAATAFKRRYGKRPVVASVGEAQRAALVDLGAYLSPDYLEELREMLGRNKIPVDAVRIEIIGVPVHVDSSVPQDQLRFFGDVPEESVIITSLAIPSRCFHAA